jgi:hypothetical protein
VHSEPDDIFTEINNNFDVRLHNTFDGKLGIAQIDVNDNTEQSNVVENYNSDNVVLEDNDISATQIQSEVLFNRANIF